MLAQVVANEDETFVSPDDACWFSTFSFDMRKLEFPEEVDELGPPVLLSSSSELRAATRPLAAIGHHPLGLSDLVEG